MDATKTWEVPREQWAAFLRQLESLQKGRPVALERVGLDVGDQTIAHDVQLRAIHLASKGTSAGTLELDLGVEGTLDHRILHPAHLYAVRAPSGLLACLDIEDEGHGKTLLHFKEPLALPESHAAVPRSGGALVRDHMTAPARVLPLGSTLAQAVELMQSLTVRHLPVVDSDGRPVGILSDRNASLAKRERGIPPEDVSVEELMTPSPYTVTPDTPLDEVAAVMAERKYGCAIVVAGGRVAGILTTTDVLGALVQRSPRGSGERH